MLWQRSWGAGDITRSVGLIQLFWVELLSERGESADQKLLERVRRFRPKVESCQGG